MLEGAFYGLDLLKLHSVTTKLVGRVDKLEEVRSILGLHIFLLIKPSVSTEGTLLVAREPAKCNVIAFFFRQNHILMWL